MLYREPKTERSLDKALLRFFYLFDSRARRQRRVEQDLLSLSPYLQRDIGWH
jgi:hypothetical protein